VTGRQIDIGWYAAMDTAKYERMRDAGAGPTEVYHEAVRDGYQSFTAQVNILRQVFGLSLVEAKEAYIIAQGLADSLDEYQGRIADDLSRYLDETESEDSPENPNDEGGVDS
jgi:hypothetical protein